MKPKLTPELLELKAHSTGELKFLLLDHFMFRAYIVFNNKKKFNPYGNEHKCTYSQLVARRFPNILLDRLKGYTDLIRLIEHSYKGKYTTAAIYMRDAETKEFDHLCRRYDASGIQEINDPVLSEDDQFKTICYTVENNRLYLYESDPTQPDFKNLVQNQLQ